MDTVSKAWKRAAIVGNILGVISLLICTMVHTSEVLGVGIILFACSTAIALWFASMTLLIGVVEQKSASTEYNSILWLIGIFLTPVVVGIFAASIPDVRLTRASKGSE